MGKEDQDGVPTARGITFRSNSMDIVVLQQMANRSDGKLPAEWQSRNPMILDQPDAPADGTTDENAADSSTGEGNGKAESNKERAPNKD